MLVIVELFDLLQDPLDDDATSLSVGSLVWFLVHMMALNFGEMYVCQDSCIMLRLCALIIDALRFTFTDICHRTHIDLDLLFGFIHLF